MVPIQAMRTIIPVTIDKKLVTLVITVSLIGIGITIFLSFHYANIILGERVMNQLKGESGIRGDSIGSILESKTQQIQVITTNPMIKSLILELNTINDTETMVATLPQTRMDFLIEVQAFEASIGGLNDLENIEIVGNDGQRLFALINAKTKKDYLTDPGFIRAEKESFAEIVLGNDGKRKVITAAPIFAKPKDATPIGVAIITANTQLVDQVLLNRQGLGKTGESYVVNADRYMISESRFAENSAFHQKVNTPPIDACFLNGQNYEGLYTDYRGQQVLGASSCIKNSGLVVLVEIDDTEVFEPVADLRDKITVIGAIITVLVGVAACFLSKLISRPLVKLQNAANRIADGDFDVRTNIRTADEIGQLSRAFDQMSEKIQDSLLKIKEREDVITQNNGVVVKNIGDALLYYFPKTDSEETAPFEETLECCLKLIDARQQINQALSSENLPQVSYRISAMFGPVRV